MLKVKLALGIVYFPVICPPIVANIPASAIRPYEGKREEGEGKIGQSSLCKGGRTMAHIDVDISRIGENIHPLKVNTRSFEVVHMDGPFRARVDLGGDVSLRGGSPCESLVADVAREVDDDVRIVDAMGILQFLLDLLEPKARQEQRISKTYGHCDVKGMGPSARPEVFSTHSYAETVEALSGPRIDRKQAIGTSSSLDADDDLIGVTQAVRTVNWDEARLAGETVVPGLEAVLRAWIQREGDRPVVEDVSDLVERRDCKRAAVEELAVGPQGDPEGGESKRNERDGYITEDNEL